MIVHKISVDTHLSIVDADSDGFALDNEEGGRMWLSYDNLDEVAHVLASIRAINAAHEPTA